MFVFSGILPICDGEDGLAAVLGHEIAHNVAHHTAERISKIYGLMIIMYGLVYLVGVPDVFTEAMLEYGFLKPGSRKQEVNPTVLYDGCWYCSLTLCSPR